MTRLDVVLAATFHEDWLKYFKPLHAPTAGSVREKPEEHAGAGKGGGSKKGGFYRAVGFNFGKRRGQGSDATGGECLDASIGRVKGLVLRYLGRGLKRTSKGLDRWWPVCGGNVRGVEGIGRGCAATEFEREWIARAIGQKQSVATECSTRTKEHRGGPRDKRLIFVFC